jgi:CDP-paratose 2-epimerase
MEHNLLGTLHLLEKCKRDKASFILLSTSRVYSIIPLSRLPVTVHAAAFAPAPGATLPPGISGKGITESFSTTPPVSLYGASKLTSETLALEYGAAFDFPVWINRCGVLAGAGQFGRPDQGIFSYWINAHLRRRPLRFIGFDGAGHQVRDCLHPRDLLPLLRAQMGSANQARCPQVINVSGGQTSARSLAQLTAWCNERFGPHPVTPENMPRPFDLPWVVLDSQLAKSTWQWQPSTPVDVILEEIANHAMEHPAWLDQTA